MLSTIGRLATSWSRRAAGSSFNWAGVAAAAAAGTAVCGLTTAAAGDEDSFVMAWGSGQYGQTGFGSEFDQPLPTNVEALDRHTVTQISTGGAGVCSMAVTKAGSIFTWGRGQGGALGHGLQGLDQPNQDVPRQLLSGLPAGFRPQSVGVGVAHMAAVGEDGAVYTWGMARSGRLGRQGENDRPGKVDLPVAAVSVACGNAHTVAVGADGSVWSWGDGFYGATGLGKKPTKAPVKVPGFGAAFGKAVAVSAGRDFTLVQTEAGELYAFGDDQSGQCAQGFARRRQMEPQKIGGLGGRRVAHASCGDAHAAALCEDGTLWTWGAGKDGQLCLGDRSDKGIPCLVEPAVLEKAAPDAVSTAVRAVQCGGNHTLILLDDEKTVLAVGRGRNGQLGRGDSIESIAAYRTEPVQCLLPTSDSKSGGLYVKAIAAGYEHNMALIAGPPAAVKRALGK